MKTKLFLLLFILVSFSACKKNSNLTVLCGRYSDYPNTELKLVNVDNYFPGLKTDLAVTTIKTDSSGNFVFRTNLTNSGFYQVLMNDYQLLKYDIYLEPGDSVCLPAGGNNYQFVFSGRGFEKLNYQVQDYKVYPLSNEFYQKVNGKSFTTELMFKDFIDSITNKRLTKLNSDKTTPRKLKEQFENDIYFEGAGYLLNHLERRNYTMKDEFGYYYPDSSYLTLIENLKFDNEFCNSTLAKGLAGEYLTWKAREAFKGKNDSIWWEENLKWKLDYIGKQPESVWTDNLALSTIYYISFGKMNRDFFENLRAFDKKMERRFYSDENRKLFKRNLAPYYALAPGSPAPDFALPDSTGKIVRLSDFKGKIVFVDIWGTWCYPCIEEIPDALELQKKYKDKPVVFLYVAIEYNQKNIDNWKNFIAGKDKRFGNFLGYKPFPGVHLVGEKQFRNEALKPYILNFVPMHVLVDAKGNLENARADGAKQISGDIDKLLAGN